MSIENGEWVIRGLSWDNPLRIRTRQELINWVKEIGFLPLFGNEIRGFSAEEHTWTGGWWGQDPEEDPWEWRMTIARGKEVAYGKFFNKKAGFISLKWLPVFANYRRRGYDFDSLYEDGLASGRGKKIMDLFGIYECLPSYELKKLAGFGKNGEKNFNGVVTDLQMQTYLVAKDFRQRMSKRGKTYGWFVNVLSTPERVWGHDLVTSAYCEEPKASGEKIFRRVKEVFNQADEKSIIKVCGL